MLVTGLAPLGQGIVWTLTGHLKLLWSVPHLLEMYSSNSQWRSRNLLYRIKQPTGSNPWMTPPGTYWNQQEQDSKSQNQQPTSMVMVSLCDYPVWLFMEPGHTNTVRPPYKELIWRGSTDNCKPHVSLKDTCYGQPKPLFQTLNCLRCW